MSEASALPTGRFGPGVRGGEGRAGPDPARVALSVLVVLLAVGLVAAGTAASLLAYGQSELSTVDVGGRSAPGEVVGGAVTPDEVEEVDGVFNVLAVGSDSREGLSREQMEALGTEEADGARTDSIMLVQLDTARDRASVLSFPRDLLVTRCDGSRGRINAAYGIGEEDGRGGPTCLVETIAELTGIPVHHFVEVDFAGFIDVVDALGGVSMWLDEPLQDAHAGVDLADGCVDMDGMTALGFVRARRVDDDFGRIGRQQQFLHAVLDEAVSVGTLVNPPRLFRLVGSGARAVETDDDLTVGRMQRIAFSMRGIDPDELDVYTVPGHDRSVNGAWMIEADEEEAERLYAAFREADDVPAGVGLDLPASGDEGEASGDPAGDEGEASGEAGDDDADVAEQDAEDVNGEDADGDDADGEAGDGEGSHADETDAPDDAAPAPAPTPRVEEAERLRC